MNLRSLDKKLVTILLIVFVQMVGAGLILPILPLYGKNEFGLSPTAVSLLVAAFFAAQFIGGPILGRWSDKVGRVPVLVISQVGTVVAFLLLGFAWSAWVLFAARILDGITGGNIVVAQAYVTDVTPREDRAKSLGLIAAMFGLAFFIGPAIGGLMSGLGPRVPYFAAAVAAALVVILTVFTLDESMSAEERESLRDKAQKLSIRDALRIRPLVFTMIIAFITQFGLGLIMATFALFGEAVLFDSNPELGVGLLLAFVGLAQILTQTAVLPRALTWIGEERVMVLGILVRTVSLVIYAFTVSPMLAAVGGMLFAMGGGLTMPPTQSIATKAVDDSLRGGVLGAIQSVVSMSVIISTAVGGALFAVYAHLPNQVALGASILALVPAVLLVRHMKHNPEVEGAWARSDS